MQVTGPRPGFENAPYRDHFGDYQQQADMESGNLYAKQGEVKRLPVPALHDTLELFLRSSKPHVSDAEWARTQRAVAEFGAQGGLGEKLQERLELRAKNNPNSSWLIKWWNEYAYLGYRDSVVYNVTYYLQFMDEGAGAMSSPVRRAARFTAHGLLFRNKVAMAALEPDEGKSGPMSNTQHKFTFNTCRMPAAGSDFVRTYDPSRNHHISVARKNRFFTFDVCEADGTPLSADAIEAQLHRVVAAADRLGAAPHAVGILSGDDRDSWVASRALVVENPENAASLERIQSSIWMVCLDDTSPETRVEVGHALLHSDGKNRFWDKSFQLVFFENGKGGFVGEHSMTDGLTTTRFVNETLEILFADPESEGPAPPPLHSTVYAPGRGAALPEPEECAFSLSTAAQTAVLTSTANFNAVIATKELDVLMFHGYGKQKIKTFKLSPDAFAQLVIQLAYRRTFGFSRGTYESTQTRTFLHGRTEVTRSCSQESEAFVDAMVAGRPPAERLALLRTAASAHSIFTKRAAQGKGVDRHLLGLKLLMTDNEQAAIFSDPAYTRSGTWAISTSGLTGELMDGWGFGEVVPDGIGVGYTVLKGKIRYTVTSRHKWASRMVYNLEKALLDMGALCTAPPTSKL